jgi:excisionase family DNA binding protein
LSRATVEPGLERRLNLRLPAHDRWNAPGGGRRLVGPIRKPQPDSGGQHARFRAPDDRASIPTNWWIPMFVTLAGIAAAHRGSRRGMRRTTCTIAGVRHRRMVVGRPLGVVRDTQRTPEEHRWDASGSPVAGLKETAGTSVRIPTELADPSSPSRRGRGAAVTCACGGVKALLSVGEAAERLGLHRTTVYRMIESGQLPVHCFRVGNTTKLSWAQVEEWLRTAPAQASAEFAPTHARRPAGSGAGLQAPRRARGASGGIHRYSSAT